MKTLTFHDDPALKGLLLARIGAHEEADAIAKGAYERWNGRPQRCAVGCSLRDLSDKGDVPADWHAEYERVLGIPAWLAKLEDHVFERLPAATAKGWPRRFSAAVPVGVELGGLADRLAIRRLREECLPLSGTWPASVRGEVVAAIEQVIAALERKDDEAWAAPAAARAAAESAAESAESARSAAAESAVESAAESAAWAAWAAESARAAAESAAWAAAESARSAAWAAPAAAAEAAAARSAAAAARSAYEREASRIVEELERIGAEVAA